MIKPVEGGFVVVSHTGKRLSKVYKSKAAAEMRLRQIEYFKNKKA